MVHLSFLDPLIFSGILFHINEKNICRVDVQMRRGRKTNEQVFKFSVTQCLYNKYIVNRS